MTKITRYNLEIMRKKELIAYAKTLGLTNLSKRPKWVIIDAIQAHLKDK